MKHLPIVGFLLCLLLVSTAAWAFQPDAEAIPETRRHLERLEKLGFSGSVLIALRGEVLHAQGYGEANRETGVRWTPETVSTVGSITKQFTAAAILLLEEEGKLSVTDRLPDHFKNVPADKQEITLHQLLTHSSGIVDLDGVGDWDPLGREEFVRRALEQELAFAPGEGYQYSNANYSLLGAIIEQQSGVSYETFVRERLFLPHGMRDTGYILADWTPDSVAVGYRRGGEVWGTVLGRPMAEDGPYWPLRANGGIHSTAMDMLRWAEALRGGRVLKPESLDALWSPHVDEGVGSFYGYGWAIQNHGGAKVVTHNGGNSIYFADYAILPEQELVVYLHTNAVQDFPGANRLLELMGYRLLAGQPYPKVPDRVPVAASVLDDAAGVYALAGGSRLQVTAGESELRVEAEGPDAFALLHSVRGPDLARSARLSKRMDEIARAMTSGDFGPLAAAYGGRVGADLLRTRWEETLRQEAESGALTGHEILGTALAAEWDVTLVRFRFERGHLDRAYVWDAEAEAHLLGVSQRGMDPVLRFLPDAAGGFASWDGGLSPSVLMRIQDDSSAERKLILGAGIEAVRTP